LGYYPKDTRDNDLTNINLTFLFSNPSGFGAYNADTAIGWRGPYLTNGSPAPFGLDSSFSAVFDSATAASGTVHSAIAGGSIQVLDAWGRPVVLQIPLDSNNSYQPGFDYARLVSAGPGNGIEPGDAAIDTQIAYNGSSGGLPDASDRNDDRILYLRSADPFIPGNIPCDEI